VSPCLFSRSQETEADWIALILMAKADYDPRTALEFWQRMKKKTAAKKRRRSSFPPVQVMRPASNSCAIFCPRRSAASPVWATARSRQLLTITGGRSWSEITTNNGSLIGDLMSWVNEVIRTTHKIGGQVRQFSPYGRLRPQTSGEWA
jgi:hypothetical protein